MIVESENNMNHFASQRKLAQSLEQSLILIILTFPFQGFAISNIMTLLDT